MVHLYKQNPWKLVSYGVRSLQFRGRFMKVIFFHEFYFLFELCNIGSSVIAKYTVTYICFFFLIYWNLCNTCFISNYIPSYFLHQIQNLAPFSYLFWVSVEIEIDHDIPRVVTTDGSSKSKNFSCQQPPHQTNRVGTLKYITIN